MKNKKLYWLSFSFKGENQGICVVEANSIVEAKIEAEQLGLIPENDDIFCIEIPSLDKEIGISLNKFYSREEMQSVGYKTTKEIGLCDDCIEEMRDKE